MIRKRYQLIHMFECPDAVLTCSVLKCHENSFLVFGGHDKTLYLMNEQMNILDDRVFDGWCRCTYPVDLDGDGCDEVLVGAGDGNFMVLKLNPDRKKLVGIMRYRSPKRINCCIAGDFTRDGNIELVFGSEDKTLKIFDNIKAKEPKFIFYYDSWVTTCTLGILKLPDEKIPIYGLLVGTKSGIVQLIRFTENFPEIVWQKDFNTQINDIKVGDVTNDGFNEILLSSDDSTIKILDSNGELIKQIQIDEGRPLSLLIEDVDGDNASEIVAGCADGSLKVFHNPAVDSTDFELKWKTKVSTSIKDICFRLDPEQKKNIVFGGYDRTIRIVSDFEWGDKQPLNIPQQLKVEKIEPTEKERIINEIANAQEVPTNIREHIFEILLKKEYLKDLATELRNLDYTEDEILEELTVLKTQKAIVYEKVEYPVWSLPLEEREEKAEKEAPAEEPKVAVKHMIIEEPIKTDKEKLSDVLSSAQKEEAPEEKPVAEGSLSDIIIEYLKEKGIVGTKSELVDSIKEKGFSTNQIEKEIIILKEQGRIKYSRAKPKGWSLGD
ncbi:MAG: WD40 repeat domain-containing protein [Candidatus Thorarchaeota archaeon]